ncbi:MAG: LPS assembly protein LptD [Rudaea sp.]
MPIYNQPHLSRWRLLSLALCLSLAQLAGAAEPETTPVCPVGVLKCPQKPRQDEFAMCKRNAMLDFYVPGLPTTGDRSKATSDLSANTISSTDSSHYVAEGNVEVQRLDQLLRADTLNYNTQTTAYTATGHVRMQDRSILASADRGHGTGTPSTTYLENVRYQMLEQRGNGTAASANMTDPDHGTLSNGTYSTCDPDDRRWYLRAREMELDQTVNRGYAHDVTMYYGDVPFFWLPYLRFPLSKERVSGFLFPNVGYSNRRGLVLGAPYYLNLAPNYDATVDPMVSSKRGAMLEGEFRYLDKTDKTQLDITYVPHDNQVDDEIARISAAAASGHTALLSPVEIPNQRYALRLRDTSALSPNWSAAININRVSDQQYFQDFGDNLTTSATALLGSSAYLNGRGSWWSASVGADSAQLTQLTLSQAAQPYQRLPRGTFQGEHSLIGALDWGMNAEYVNFRKGPYDVLASAPDTFRSVTAINGQRLDLYPYLAFPVETAGYFIRPELGVRYTTYDLRELDGYAATHPGAAQFGDNSPTRTVPIFNLDAGMIFERPATYFGRSFTQTLEPRLYYLRVPYRDQSDLPIFDTQLPTFDFPSLFRSNTFVGADRQSNANNLTLALTSRLIDSDSGDEILRGSIGQIHYFDAQRVQLPGRPEVDFSGSDYVAELDLRLNDRWELRWDQQYNPNSRVVDPSTQTLIDNMHSTDLSAVSVEHRFGSEGALNFSYRFRRGLLEQVDTTALLPLNARWSLVGRYYYSLMDNRLLETFAGVEYDSCCVALRVLARRYISSLGQIKTSNGVYFELEFKGIGSTGTRAENFLRRAILGYQ